MALHFSLNASLKAFVGALVGWSGMGEIEVGESMAVNVLEYEMRHMLHACMHTYIQCIHTLETHYYLSPSGKMVVLVI